MSDFLLDLNPTAKRFIKRLGLPLPMPQPLRRGKGPYTERPLANRSVVFGSAPGGELAKLIAKSLVVAGADPFLSNGDGPAFAEVGEAYGRPARSIDIDNLEEGFRAHALVFDATAIADVAGLRQVYDFFHPLVKSVDKCGRVLLLGRVPGEAKTAEGAAARAALEGFVRSLAKELGKKGITVQLLQVGVGAESRIEGAVRFLLGPRSAFVTGQPITLSASLPAEPEPVWTRPLEGKVALVTGAARGIGAATARRLAEEGAHVVCLDRPADDGPTSQVARSIGGSVLLADVTDADAPERIATELKKQHGGVDIVVHNAGVTRDKTLARMKPELWEQAIDINLGAVARITDKLMSTGTLRSGGRVICLSSVAGIAGNVGQTNYAASKAGIIGLVRQLSLPLGKKGISVNAIAPGFIETRLTAAIPTVIREVGRRLAALGQGGQPVDVAEAITFLSTPASSGINGQVLRVCGGAFIGA
jgi:3-oxoacyl-[acyl-carrier protein] reductase